jgi:hypothetical protein
MMAALHQEARDATERTEGIRRRARPVSVPIRDRFAVCSRRFTLRLSGYHHTRARAHPGVMVPTSRRQKPKPKLVDCDAPAAADGSAGGGGGVMAKPSAKPIPSLAEPTGVATPIWASSDIPAEAEGSAGGGGGVMAKPSVNPIPSLNEPTGVATPIWASSDIPAEAEGAGGDEFPGPSAPAPNPLEKPASASSASAVPQLMKETASAAVKVPAILTAVIGMSEVIVSLSLERPAALQQDRDALG